jgi:hypothetical protein
LEECFVSKILFIINELNFNLKTINTFMIKDKNFQIIIIIIEDIMTEFDVIMDFEWFIVAIITVSTYFNYLSINYKLMEGRKSFN